MSYFTRARDRIVSLLTTDPDGYLTGVLDFTTGEPAVRDGVIEYICEGLMSERYNAVFASRGLTGDFGLSASYQTLPFDTPTITNTDYYTFAAGVVTIQEAGRYAVDFSARIEAGGDADFQMALAKNGTPVTQTGVFGSSPLGSLSVGQFTTLTHPRYIDDFAVNDTIEVVALSGASAQAVQQGGHFSITAVQ